MRTGTRRAFTLIELLIVIVVISILAALAFPKFANTKQRAARSAGLADVHNLATQEERFYSENSRYGNIPDTAALRFTPSPGNSALAITLAGAPAGTTGYNAVISIRQPDVRCVRRCRTATGRHARQRCGRNTRLLVAPESVTPARRVTVIGLACQWGSGATPHQPRRNEFRTT